MDPEPIASTQYPSLVVIHGNDLGTLYNLNISQVTIGRSANCEIKIEHGAISRNHARIVITGTSVVIRDLGSTNGTYVNDEPIEEHVLSEGDLLKVGRTIFKFLRPGSIERPFHEHMYRMLVTNRSPNAPVVVSEGSTTTTISAPEGTQDDHEPT